jgi:hypothetical protein
MFDLLKSRTLLCAKGLSYYGMCRAIRKIRVEARQTGVRPTRPDRCSAWFLWRLPAGRAARRVNAEAAD